MILEGVVTTLDEFGNVNVAPMGPIVDASMERLLLRPFQTSTTFQNLKRSQQGVFHITDDVLLIAQAAISQLKAQPPMFAAKKIDGNVIADACRWYEFVVESIGETEIRTEIEARVVHSERLRDFVGFHRARHAVIEAAILATRLHILESSDVDRQMSHLKVIVDKTADETSQSAFQLLEDYIVGYAES